VGAVTELVIRPLDPHDDADMDAFQEVYAAAELDEDPDAQLYSRADGVEMLLATDGGHFCDGFGAFEGDRMVGELMVNGATHDNLDVARVWIWVAPGHCRRGVGTRLAAHAEQRVRRLGRRVCQAQARIGLDRNGRGRRFAESLGYSLANTEIERRLALPADAGLLDRLAAEAAPHHPAYTIRAVTGPVPDDLAASYVALKNLLITEAPSGDLEVEEGRETVSDLRAQDRLLVASGRTRVAAYALAPDGSVAGYAVAAVTGEGYDHVDQWGTLVHPAHRGHRLGMAVKCAQLRELSERFPDKHFVGTTNAETNAQMVAINVELGFAIHQVYGEFQKRLPPV
jgi:GNAT superfamily N-acetyltransferase